jgi:hypothetical protein
MILSNVDFPQPDGPMMEKNSPAFTSNETSFTASTWSKTLPGSPNALLTLRSVRIAIKMFLIALEKVGLP